MIIFRQYLEKRQKKQRMNWIAVQHRARMVRLMIFLIRFHFSS